jgi:DNA polymerase V
MDAPDHLEISLDQLLKLRAPGTYLVKCGGDSMLGAGIFSGDMLIVDKGREALPGSIVIGVINREPTVKYLSYTSCGQPILRSGNKAYPDRYILENDEFEVWGVVTHSIRDHDGK